MNTPNTEVRAYRARDPKYRSGLVYAVKSGDLFFIGDTKEQVGCTPEWMPASRFEALFEEVAQETEAAPVEKVIRVAAKWADDLRKRFSYHPPKREDIPKFTDIRHVASGFAHLCVASCPEGRELSLALTNIEQAVMWANAAIARAGAE